MTLTVLHFLCVVKWGTIHITTKQFLYNASDTISSLKVVWKALTLTGERGKGMVEVVVGTPSAKMRRENRSNWRSRVLEAHFQLLLMNQRIIQLFEHISKEQMLFGLFKLCRTGYWRIKAHSWQSWGFHNVWWGWEVWPVALGMRIEYYRDSPVVICETSETKCQDFC